MFRAILCAAAGVSSMRWLVILLWLLIGLVMVLFPFQTEAEVMRFVFRVVNALVVGLSGLGSGP